MFEVTVRMCFYDHRARLNDPTHDLLSVLKIEKKEDISKRIEHLVVTACKKVSPEITYIQIHKGYEIDHTPRFTKLFEKDSYDFTNTSDCAILKKWNDHEYHLCKRVAPLKWLSKRNCYAGLLEDVQYDISVRFDVTEIPVYND